MSGIQTRSNALSLAGWSPQTRRCNTNALRGHIFLIWKLTPQICDGVAGCWIQPRPRPAATPTRTGTGTRNPLTFTRNDDALQPFLPMRRIERVLVTGFEAGNIASNELAEVWLTPPLIQSCQHLRVLEVWMTDRETWNAYFLSTIAPYLTSLPHLLLVDWSSYIHPGDYLLLLMGKIRALESFTIADMDNTVSNTESEAEVMVDLVLTVCPYIAGIFVGGFTTPRYYQYTKGRGLHNSPVSQEVACRPYTKWVREPVI